MTYKYGRHYDNLWQAAGVYNYCRYCMTELIRSPTDMNNVYDPEGIRHNRWCPCCNQEYGSTKAGLIDLRMKLRIKENTLIYEYA